MKLRLAIASSVGVSLCLMVAPGVAMSQNSPPSIQSAHECLVSHAPELATLKLDSNCPTGKGLWGRAPQSADSALWIQCRYDTFPISTQDYAYLYTNVSQTIVEQNDGNGYRCLIGPYSDHEQALYEQLHLQQHPKFAEVFLREVANK